MSLDKRKRATMAVVAGTPGFMAPELLRPDAVSATFASGMYSYGRLLEELGARSVLVARLMYDEHNRHPTAAEALLDEYFAEEEAAAATHWPQQLVASRWMSAEERARLRVELAGYAERRAELQRLSDGRGAGAEPGAVPAVRLPPRAAAAEADGRRRRCGPAARAGQGASGSAPVAAWTRG